MSEQVLTILKLCLLAMLYLFFLRVLWAVWSELRAPKPKAARGVDPRIKAMRRERRSDAQKQLLVLEPAELSGRNFPLGEELTVGRAAGCQITLDDTFVSQIHARIFVRDEQYLVEDLGSTNGTYLNRTKVGGPMVMQPGDHLQVGGTVMELA